MVEERMLNGLDDRTVLDTFVAYLQATSYPGLKVDRRPEDENRTSADIEAVAGNLAIEHTSIDTVAQQRQHADWFMKAVSGLESELSSTLTYWLSITLPYEGVQRGQQWSKLRDCFITWIIHASPALPEGAHILRGEPGIPFEFHVVKRRSRRPGLYFSRFAPDDSTLPGRIRAQLDRKAQKLRPYKQAGYTTILLVESNDIALMNPHKMLEAIRVGFSRCLPDGVDQVWYADTAIPGECSFHDFTKAVQE